MAKQQEQGSLYDYDAGYYEYIPDVWLPGKLIGLGVFGTWSKRAVDGAKDMELDDSDVLISSYPKTGRLYFLKNIFRISPNISTLSNISTPPLSGTKKMV